MDRFDTAIIGAGPEGLIAAIILARAGLRVVLLEKSNEAGGRATTREFHPGFRASPYADELPTLSARLYRLLDLGRRGAIFAPTPVSYCVSDSGESVFFADESRTSRAVSPLVRAGLFGFRNEVDCMRQAIEHRALQISPHARKFMFFRDPVAPEPWPAGGWAHASLDECLRARIADPALRLHLTAEASSGRAVAPLLAGTALHLLAPGAGLSGQPPGGLGRLGKTLARIAADAGVTIRCGVEVTSIQAAHNVARALVLNGRDELEARSILSTLDLKRTMLHLVGRKDVSAPLAKRVSRYRQTGQMARVLFALDSLPRLKLFHDAPDAVLGPIHIIGSIEALSSGYESWLRGKLAHAPLVTLRVPSYADPRLAPVGKAVMTATLSPVPSQLVEANWLNEKRKSLVETALIAAERVMPGVSSRVLGYKTIVGPDIEASLGLTDGDLDGGEFAPDQALGFRPMGDLGWQDGRTPVGSLYLAGPSAATSPFFLGASGERAALAILTDLKIKLPE